jgi:hypothetical protein
MIRRLPFHRFGALLLVVGLGITAVACSKTGADDGVASLNGGGNANGAPGTTAPLSAQEREALLLKYTQCLREHGVNVPDPQVDANGNLQLGGRGGGGAGGGGAGQTPGSIDRSAFDAARKACGDPPRLGGRFNPENQAQFQDAALKFAKCMRDKGVDVPDPDFSQAPQGGPGGNAGGGGNGGPPGTGAGGRGGGGGGFFGSLNRDDPKVQAAFQECRSAFGNLPGGGPGGQGGPGGGTGGGGTGGGGGATGGSGSGTPGGG